MRLFFFGVLFPQVFLKRVAFNGASVTCQKNGYVEETRKLYPDWTVDKIGYGASSVSVCLIKQILDLNPEIVFLDWSLHACGPHEREVIRTLVWKLKNINSIPVFIHMPRVDKINHTIVKTINDLSEELNFSVIDLRNQFTFDELKEKYLRDNVHTNNLGAAAYGKKIYEFLEKNTLKIPKNFDIEPMYMGSIEYQYVENTFYKTLEFELKGLLLGIHGKVGPYSNYLQQNVNNIPLKKIRLWDRWCYYERMQFLGEHLYNAEFSKIQYQILKLNFDRINCNKNVTWDWNEFVPKFEVEKLCFIGKIKNLKIDD